MTPDASRTLSPGDLAARLVSEGNAEARAALYMLHKGSVGLELVEVLKAEVDRHKDADGALALLAGERALEASLRAAAPAAKPLGRWALALGLTLQGRFSEALPHFEEAYAAYNALSRPLDAARVAMRQVQALAMTGDLGGALDLATEIRGTFARAGEIREAAGVDNNLGAIYARLGRTAEAEAVLKRALAGFSQLNDASEIAKVHINLGYTCGQRDGFSEARAHFTTALSLLERLGHKEAVAGTTVDLALLYRREGRLAGALGLLKKAGALYQELGTSADAALAKLEEARVYLDLNLLVEAEREARSLAETFAGRDMVVERAEALQVLGLARARAGEGAGALGALEDAREAWEGVGNAAQAALVDVYTAEVLLAAAEAQGTSITVTHPSVSENADAKNPQGDALARALEGATRALTTLSAAGVRSGRVRAALTVVGARRALGEGACNSVENSAPETGGLLEEARTLARELGVPDLVIRAEYLAGLFALEGGAWARAEAHFKEAVAYLEDARASLSVDQFKAAYIGDKTAVYGDLVRLLLTKGRVTEAFEYAERAKSRALLEGLTGGSDTGNMDTGDMDTGETDLQPSAVSGETGSAEERTDTASYAGKSYTEALAAALDGATALIAYFASGDHLLAFVVTREGVRAATDLAPLREVQYRLERLEFFLTRVAQGGAYEKVYGVGGLRRNVDTHLSALYDGLIKPLALSDKYKNLVVVPHGPLHAVPFAALCEGQGKRQGEGQGKRPDDGRGDSQGDEACSDGDSGYLIDRVRLSLAPSAAVYLHCAEMVLPASGPLVAFGVPVDDIPAVADEVETITQTVAQGAIQRGTQNVGEAARAFLGPHASRAAFSEHAPAAHVLHLATHGVYRPDNPMFSGLSLSDGWLTARDLCDMKLRASLVVLSACDTGRSSGSGGDEQFGLVRGFLYAGAPALVVSLWPVKDEQTALFMTSFYEYLQEDLGVAAALRRAQLALRRLLPDPYYWAAFTVIGDPDRQVLRSHV